jgi:hypothetical protein
MPKPKESVTEKLLDELIKLAMNFSISEDMEVAQQVDDIKRRLLGRYTLRHTWDTRVQKR